METILESKNPPHFRSIVKKLKKDFPDYNFNAKRGTISVNYNPPKNDTDLGGLSVLIIAQEDDKDYAKIKKNVEEHRSAINGKIYENEISFRNYLQDISV